MPRTLGTKDASSTILAVGLNSDLEKVAHARRKTGKQDRIFQGVFGGEDGRMRAGRIRMDFAHRGNHDPHGAASAAQVLPSLAGQLVEGIGRRGDLYRK